MKKTGNKHPPYHSKLTKKTHTKEDTTQAVSAAEVYVLKFLTFFLG